MATNLPLGAFLTTIGGKKCTAVPFRAANVTVTTSSLLTTTLVSSTTTTASLQVTAAPDQPAQQPPVQNQPVLEQPAQTSTETTETQQLPASSAPAAAPTEVQPPVAAPAPTQAEPTSTTSAAETTAATTTSALQDTTAPTAAPTTSTTSTTSTTTPPVDTQVSVPTTTAALPTTTEGLPTTTEALPTTPAVVPTTPVVAPSASAQDPPPAQDVVEPTTAIATTPQAPQPVTSVQEPTLTPLPSTEATAPAIAPIATPGEATSTTVAELPTTPVAGNPAPTTPISAPSADVPADTQPQPTDPQPVAGTTGAAVSTDGILQSAVTTSTTLAGAPVLAGPVPTQASDVFDPVPSSDESGGVVVVPTQPASPGPSTIPTIADTKPQETALPSLSSGSGMGPQATAAVAGSVAGTVVLIGILAFLFCWRRRKRRNSSGSPSSPNSAERGVREKEPYVITRSSIGPTPNSQKFKASLSYKYKEACLQVVELGVRAAETIGLRKRTDVDLDRGPSQYGPLMTGAHSRSNSGADALPVANVPPKREYPDWWDRLTQDDGQNWTLKPGQDINRASSNVMGADPTAARNLPPPIPPRRGPVLDGGPTPTRTNSTGQAPGRAAPTARLPQPRLAAPSDHFMSNMGLNFEAADPFSDVNSMSHVSAMVMPLSTPTESNPFSDTNALPTQPQAKGPRNHIQGVQHARRESHNSVMRRQQADSVYRESTISQESFQTRRNRVRSDPFDLDRPDLRAAIPSNTASVANNPPQPDAPRQAHMRTHSTSSSKYSVSDSGFSDPGPDVGPGVARKRSDGSQRSVGRAM
ncbi:interleukin 15 receptor alpha [Microdochium nivale]|nr:interleukin 15 receptor alpha [Microdochium nivale]